MNKYNELRQEINKFLGQKKQQIGIMENLMDNLIEWDKSISSSENALLNPILNLQMMKLYIGLMKLETH